MIELDTLVARLRAWVATAHAWRGVDLAASKEPVLRMHAGGGAVLAAMQDSARPAHDLLVAALARQAQRSQARVWAAVLIIAAAPWLGRIADRFAPNVESADDTVSLVLEAFLTVVGRRHAGRPATAAWLKVQTRRQVIAWLRRDGRLEGGVPDGRRPRRRLVSARARARVRRLTAATIGHTQEAA